MPSSTFAQRTTRTLAATVIALIAALTVIIGAPSAATAGTLPPGGTSTVMTISNQTGKQIFLRDSRVDFGGWIEAPWGFMNPGDVQVVTVHTPNPIGLGVEIRYDTQLHGGGIVWTTTANQVFGFPWFGTTGASRGGAVGSHLFSPGPHLNAEYTLY